MKLIFGFLVPNYIFLEYVFFEFFIFKSTARPTRALKFTYNTFDIWKLSKSYLIRNNNELNVFNG